MWQKTDPRFTRKQVACGNTLKGFRYSQALRQKPGKRQFGDGVVLQALKHYAAADDDDDDDISVGFAEGDNAVSLVIVSTGCEDRQLFVRSHWTDDYFRNGMCSIRPVFSASHFISLQSHC